ncbi:hypothetical protein ACH5RR_034011 [Cinchona calisaya]|uniref:Uncharacterized protein n=1 Tax=Cinchona calisaya TaxID=153742 RepID=A0ABD2YAI6_9GENT
MNEYRDDKTCYFHPREVVIGICALCLNERLLVLASQQEQQLHQPNNTTHHHTTHTFTQHSRRNNPKNLGPRIFALSSLFNRLDLRHRKSDDQYSESPASQEDSFISIKFEDNGAASWEKNTHVLPKKSPQQYNMALKQSFGKGGDEGVIKAVIEHPKPHGSLRWRKRIGDMFQLIRWKKTGKGNVCHVGTKIDGVKVRHGWIRALTKRRTKE